MWVQNSPSPTACAGRLPISLVISAARSAARSVNSSPMRFTTAARSATGRSLHTAHAPGAAAGDRSPPPCRERLGRGGERLRYLSVRGEGESLGHLASRRVGYLIWRGL